MHAIGTGFRHIRRTVPFSNISFQIQAISKVINRSEAARHTAIMRCELGELLERARRICRYRCLCYVSRIYPAAVAGKGACIITDTAAERQLTHLVVTYRKTAYLEEIVVRYQLHCAEALRLLVSTINTCGKIEPAILLRYIAQVVSSCIR